MTNGTLERLVQRLWQVETRINSYTEWRSALTPLLEEKANLEKQINGLRKLRNAQHGR